MKFFIIICDLLALVFAILFLFFPKVVVKLSKWANQVLIYTDEKIYAIRIPIGVVMIILTIFFSYLIFKY